MTPPVTPSNPSTAPPAIDHRVVMASAGSGKTHQLTNRLIALLLMGVPAAEIVATTFTRKAAGEILERVVQRLVEAERDDTARARLAQAVGPGLTRERCLDAMVAVASSLDRIGILTIDSFFQRMAAAMAMELGAGPERRIADESEDQSLRDEALALTLERAEGEVLRDLVRILYDGKPAAGVAHRLREAIERGLTLLHETQHEPELWSVPDDRPTAPTQQDLNASIESLIAAELPKDQRWKKPHDKSIAALRAGDLDGFIGGLAKASIAGTYYGKSFVEYPSLAAAYSVAVDRVRSILRARLHDRTRATRRLLDRFAAEYESLKAERGVWRFDDVPRALLSHVGTESLDRLYYRLDGRVRHLLLDEFQDTSMLAFRLLDPLMAEIVATEPPERSLFCVGDTKQSLYVWNGAEPELLPALAGRWPQINRQTLDVSRRSSPVVLDAVNRVLGALDDPERLAGNGRVASLWHAQWSEHRAHDPNLPGEVRVIVSTRRQNPRGRASTPPPPDDGLRCADFDIIAVVERVAALQVRCPNCSIAVLVRTNRLIARIIHALKSSGIDASEEGAGSLLDSASIASLRSLLHMADHPADTAARFHVAASPLGPVVGLSPEDRDARALQVSSDLRSRVERRGLTGLLLWIRAAIAGSLDGRDASRFDAVLTLARRLDDEGGADCARLVRALDAERVRDASDAGVRVMTVHASKGLEFDAVILAELGKEMVNRAPAILAHREHPLARLDRVLCAPSPALALADPALRDIIERTKDRSLIEGLCVLYVAMTRARHVLELIVSGPSIKVPSPNSPTVYPGRLIVSALVPEAVENEIAGIVHETPRSDWPSVVNERVSRRPPPPPAPISRTLALRAAPTRASGRLARVSPSSLEGGRERLLHEILRPASPVGRSRGTVLHAMFELVGWLDDGAPSPEALATIARSLSDSDGTALEAVTAFNLALARPSIAAALTRAGTRLTTGQTLELWRERAFAARLDGPDGEPVLMTGRFDRVVVVRDAHGIPARATIVDFKTDAVRDEPMLQDRVAHYRPQVEAYRSALAATLSIPLGRVACLLLFTEAGRAVDPLTPPT